MQLLDLFLGLALLPGALSAPSVNNKRDDGAKFDEGQPISADGKGGPINGECTRTTNHEQREPNITH